jgi:hypothetical protein
METGWCILFLKTFMVRVQGQLNKSFCLLTRIKETNVSSYGYVLFLLLLLLTSWLNFLGEKISSVIV